MSCPACNATPEYAPNGAYARRGTSDRIFVIAALDEVKKKGGAKVWGC